MASQVNINFISDGFRQILTSDGVRSLVEETAKGIQSRANAKAPTDSDGFEVTTMVGGYGGGRWVSRVQAADYKAAEAEAEDKILTGSIR